MAKYPGAIYTPRARDNRAGVVYDPTKRTVIFAEDFKKGDDEIIAIQKELGLNAKGAFASVRAWLENLVASLTGHSAASTEVHGVGASTVESAAGAQKKVDTHKKATTGVHGAGANHIALFGSPGVKVTRFVPKSVAQELWRGFDNAGDSSFLAIISGTPTATSVVYTNDVRELSLPNPATYPQFGKVILHNITRGNFRKIVNVNIATNTITTEASADNWAAGDTITIGSQTCVWLSGHPHSRYFDIDISDEVPVTATAIVVEIFNNEQSGSSPGMQNNFGCHPFEVYGDAKTCHHFASAARQTHTTYILLPVVSQRICCQLGAFSSINASGTIALIRFRGYFE